MAKMDAAQMVDSMNNMDNGERILFLEYLFDNHFDIRPTGNRIAATTDHIEDRLDRNLTAEEREIMKLAFDTAYACGCKDGMEKALRSSK